jgi:hypothetical protein
MPKQELREYTTNSSLIRRYLNYLRRKLGTIPAIEKYRFQAYQAEVKCYQAKPQILHSQNQNALSQLRENGIFITDLSSFNLDLNDQLINHANLVLPILEKYPVDFEQYSISIPEDIICAHSILYTWGLQKQLLNLIENYIERPVAYHGIYFRRDFNNGLEVKSRRWHLDMEDYRMLKVIIYLKDVTETNGPFQYLSCEETQAVKTKLNYVYGYLNPQKVERIIPQEQWKSCLGKAGTVVIVDTARLLHRGKIPTDDDRYALFYDYTSRNPKNSFYCKSSLSPNTLIKLSNNITAENKDYILWRS